MSDKTRDLTLERLNRLMVAVADLQESQTAQGRMLLRMVDQLDNKMDQLWTELKTLTKTVKELAAEQVLLGNRVKNAFARALRTNIRLDDIEDAQTKDAQDKL